MKEWTSAYAGELVALPSKKIHKVELIPGRDENPPA